MSILSYLGMGFGNDPPAVGNVRSGVTFNQGEAGTFVVPAVGNVGDGVLYGAAGVEFEGTLAPDYPAVGHVRNGITFNFGASSGTLFLPPIANVQNGVGFGTAGTEFGGTLDITTDYPSANHVRFGVVFKFGASTGNLVLPAIADVESLVTYGTNGTELTGTLAPTSDNPSVNDVRAGVVFNFGASEGNLVLPAVGNVVDGVFYGALGVEFEGTRDISTDYPVQNNVRSGVSYFFGALTGALVMPAVNKVEDGTFYGAGGTEFEGTLVPVCDYPAETNVLDQVVYAEGAMIGNVVLPPVAKVEFDTFYGANGVELSGILLLPANLPTMLVKKLTDVDPTTAPVPSDVVYVVTDPGGVPASRKVALSNLDQVWNAGNGIQIDSIPRFAGLGIGVADPVSTVTINGDLAITDGIAAPDVAVGFAKLYVDAADGDLKVKFGDGTIKTIMTDS